MALFSELMPSLADNGEPVEAQLYKLKSCVYQLCEQLDYTLKHLDSENMTSAYNKNNTDAAERFAEGLTNLRDTADGIGRKITSLAVTTQDNVYSLQQDLSATAEVAYSAVDAADAVNVALQQYKDDSADNMTVVENISGHIKYGVIDQTGGEIKWGIAIGEKIVTEGDVIIKDSLATFTSSEIEFYVSGVLSAIYGAEGAKIYGYLIVGGWRFIHEDNGLSIMYVGE